MGMAPTMCGEDQTPCRTERRAARPPSFVEAIDVTTEFRALRQHTLAMSVPVFLLYIQGEHIISGYRQNRLLFSLSSLTCCFLCRSTGGSFPPLFFLVMFPFVLYDECCSPF